MINPDDLADLFWRDLASRAVAAFERYVTVCERELVVDESRERRLLAIEARGVRRAKADLEAGRLDES